MPTSALFTLQCLLPIGTTSRLGDDCVVNIHSRDSRYQWTNQSPAVAHHPLLLWLQSVSLCLMYSCMSKSQTQFCKTGHDIREEGVKYNVRQCLVSEVIEIFTERVHLLHRQVDHTLCHLTISSCYCWC